MVQAGGTTLSGKWSDFKVYFNNDMRDDVDKPEFKDIENDALAYGEWDYSQLFLDEDGDNTDSFTLHMMGGDSGILSLGSCNSAGLLTALQQAMEVPQDDPVTQSTANTGLFSLMARGGDATELNIDVANQMEDDNDSPPYSATLVAGAGSNCDHGWEVREIHLGSGGVAPSAMVGGFECPLGLIQIETKSDTNNNTIGIVIELVPGPYKGVMAEGWA